MISERIIKLVKFLWMCRLLTIYWSLYIDSDQPSTSTTQVSLFQLHAKLYIMYMYNVHVTDLMFLLHVHVCVI